jgi:cyclopropane-fatty-acyl-phospholipid synthase
MTNLGRLLEEYLGPDLPLGVRAYDGTELGPPDAKATIVVRSPDALRRILTRPGELGFARAYVAGDVDIEGDIFELFRLQERIPSPHFGPRELARIVRSLRLRDLRPLRPPPEEMPKRRFGLHTIRRDAESVQHHYDVSNRFYELVLGPAMTYSCALFDPPEANLAEAQAAKHELICRKLGLQPGMRLLDVGCGWGAMARHAATHHGVEVVGVTISPAQLEWGRARVEADGLADRIDLRLQDYREVTDGPFDAISSVGMFEHVGAERMQIYFERLHELLAPGGRLLNHAISRPADQPPGIDADSFVGRYVFPDGELIEVGTVVTAMQRAGFEARHVEDLREHYARTLRHWVANLEEHWDEAVAEVGANRARIWHLYMAGSSAGFEADRIQIHQVLGVKPNADGTSGMPNRPDW